MGKRLKRCRVAVVVGLTVVIAAGGVLLVYQSPWQAEPLQIVLAEPSCRVTFCIHGEVESPGIYTLDYCGASVQDAVDAAGGFTDAGDRTALNVDAPLGSGDVLCVPRDDDAPQQVNINTAAPWLLEALPGIGPTLAARIVEYREESGTFSDCAELTRVEGIGQATYDALDGLITVE